MSKGFFIAVCFFLYCSVLEDILEEIELDICERFTNWTK